MKNVSTQMLHKNSSSTSAVILVFRVKALKGIGFFSITADYHEKKGHINNRCPGDMELF
ncbi:MAG: hypothetical protein HQL09_04120 [Nitrospirae bacterium]|nr:hypothetical protein [Nitrospirota bacterium]